MPKDTKGTSILYFVYDTIAKLTFDNNL